MNRAMRRKLKVHTKELPVRKIEEVRNEYLQKCAAAGDLQYRILCLNEDLSKLNDEIKVLNQEAASMPAEEPKTEVVANEQA